MLSLGRVIVSDAAKLGGDHFDDAIIRYLRRKIDEAFSPKLIHTVRGVGYVLKEETPQKGE